MPKPVDLPRLLGLVNDVLGQPLVLVEDDDPDLCATLWDLLRERGYRVGIAHDPATAGEQLRDARFQVVLIDMRLPGGDGEARRDFRPRSRRSPGPSAAKLSMTPRSCSDRRRGRTAAGSAPVPDRCGTRQ